MKNTNTKKRNESIFITQTAIKKWGNSHGIRLSKELINRVGLKENDQVEISICNGIITIRKVKPKYLNLKERLEAFYNEPIENIFVENDQYTVIDAPVGEEIW